MKTSARNLLSGTVSAIKKGAVNDEIELKLAGGKRIVAVVTRESVVNLDLAVGMKAFALIKASSIILATEIDDVRLSARNQLSGTISQAHPGAVNSEIQLDVGDGVTITAIVTEESARGLGLTPGSKATALFKASSVLLGVPR
jgi:molybdate transport system regulatory protein